MRIRTAYKALVVLSFFLLTSCAWMGNSVVDQVAGLPASNVISDIKSTSDEYQQEKHEERVEELDQEYQEFLRSRDATGAVDETAEKSVVIKQEINRKD